MYKGKKRKFDWTFALTVGDVVAIALSFPVVFGIISSSQKFTLQAPSVITCAAYEMLMLFVMRHLNLYSWISFTRFFPSIPRILCAVMLSVACFSGARSLLGDSQHYHDPETTWLIVHAAVVFPLLLVERFLVRFLILDALRIVPVERIAFIGWSNRMERVLRALKHEMGSFQQILGFFYQTNPPESQGKIVNTYHPLAEFNDLEKSLAASEATLLIVEENSISFQQLQKLGEICSRCFVNLKVIPTAFDIWSTKLDLRVVAGIPLLGVFDLRYDKLHNRITKRAVDILCSLVGLLLSAPVIAVLAILIKRESPGPIFFRQVRLGIYGKPFEIIKLRSMRMDAEQKSGAVWAVKDDPRRLKIGTFMRAWNLDELPQFWNVLKGEMSMVGPRPERPEFVEGFKESIRYYNLRHSCKPGVTGWAAVHGLRGNTSLDDRLEYDLFYIENWNLRLDFEIIFMTLLPPKNAY
jgi:exopolysaccharide biosynthesis polyprenyl glycosylphosphotransferase